MTNLTVILICRNRISITSKNPFQQTLTLNDRQVLQQTNSSLCSRNIQTVVDYSLFLGDVIFEDFPAEVFIQRPHILQSFMGFIATCSDPHHLGTALKTLSLFGSKLNDRLIDSVRRDTKTTLSPGYPAGYEVGGTDCWEHEPIEPRDYFVFQKF